MFIAAVGSPNSFSFSIVQFPPNGSPIVAEVPTTFGGNAVAIAGTTVVVGDQSGSQVRLYSISNPAAPALLGSVATMLSGVSAVAIDGNRVVAAELNGVRLVLIDIANPASPTVIATKSTGIASISSLSFANPIAAIAGPNDFTFELVNFTTPSSATIVSVDPQVNGSPVIDFDGSRVAVGDSAGLTISLFSAGASPAKLGEVTTSLDGITSVSLSGNSVAAGSVNSGNIAVANFSNPSAPTQFSFNAALGGGVTLARVGSTLFAGDILGEEVGIFSLAANSATAGVVADSNVPSVQSLAVADVNVAATPVSGNIGASRTSIAFGAVPVCLDKSDSVVISNTGTGDLTISGSQTSAPFSVSPSGGFTLKPGKDKKLTVTFTPSAQIAVNGSLVIASDDPDTPSLSIPLTGSGAPPVPPEISVPSSVYFGACLPNYFFGKRVVIRNTSPCTPLVISSITTTSAVFQLTNDVPVTLPNATSLAGSTIAPNSSRTIIVVFAPTAQGDVNAELRIASNDPSTALKVVPLSGVGVLAKPTAFCLTLDYSRSMVQSKGPISKTAALRAAVGLFCDLLPIGEGDSIAKVGFRKDAKVLVPLAPITTAQLDLVRTEGMTYRYMTSIGGGLALAIDTVKNANTERQAILVFTDGMENLPPYIDDVLPQLEGTSVEVYCVGLGNSTDLDADTLSDLAVNSNGRFFSTNDQLLLRKDFVQVLADAFRMQMAADPDYVVARGGTRDVTFELTRCERRVRFACTWDDPDETLLVRLIAPDGTQYVPGSASSNQLLRYHTRAGYAAYVLSMPPIEGGGSIGPQAIGTWRMRVSGANLAASSQRFTAAMVVESDLEVRVKVDRLRIAAQASLAIEIAHAGAGAIEDVEFDIEWRAPTVSRGAMLSNGLARARLGQDVERTDDARNETTVDEAVRDDDAERPVGVNVASAQTVSGPEARVLAALPSAVIPVRRYRLEAQRERGGAADGVARWSIEAPPFVLDGIHELIVNVRVRSCGGIATSYRRIALAPRQVLSAAHTLVDVTRVSGGGRLLRVFVMPRDARGNPMGPGRLHQLTLTSASGVRILRQRDRLDGSYEFLVQTTVERDVLRLAMNGGHVSYPPAGRPRDDIDDLCDVGTDVSERPRGGTDGTEERRTRAMGLFGLAVAAAGYLLRR